MPMLDACRPSLPGEPWGVGHAIEVAQKKFQEYAHHVTFTAMQSYYLTEDSARLYEENAKLRELVRRYGEYTDQDRCEGCVYKRSCNDGDVDECWQLTEIRGLARELGIEVPS